jgi:hypothetical protein
VKARVELGWNSACAAGHHWSSIRRTSATSAGARNGYCQWQGVGEMSRRATRVGDLLERLWGQDLPPGDRPFQTVAEDSTLVDDAEGRTSGVVVRGDGIRVADIAAMVEASPDTEAAKRVSDSLQHARARQDSNLRPPA